MGYSKRGKNNPFDAYVTGVCLWITPRQIIILDRMFDFLQNCPEPIFIEGSVEEEAFLDFKSQINREAKIKKKKYFGVDDEEHNTLFDDHS